MQSFKYLTVLFLYWHVLSNIKGLSDQLQSSNMNAKLHDVNEAPPRLHHQRCLPSTLLAEANIIVLKTTGFREIMTVSNGYKICLYNPVLDAVILELNSRFAGKNLDLMQSIKCCNAESPQFLDVNYLTTLAEMYIGWTKNHYPWSANLHCVL